MVDTLKRWGQRALHVLNPFKFLYDALRLWLDADGLRMSAAMSFYGMLSLAPLLLLLVGLLGWWVDRATVESNLVGHVTSIMGERAAEVVQGALASARAPDQGRLASIFGFGLLLSGATGVFVELQSSLQRLWLRGQTPPEERAAWWRMAALRLRGLAYVLTLAIVGVVLMGLATIVIVPLAFNFLDYGPLRSWLVSSVPWVAMFAIVMIGIGILYRYGPNVKTPRTPIFTWGSLFAALAWGAASVGFSAYLASFNSYNRIYGSIGAVVALLMWFYLAGFSVMLGALINVELDRHRRFVQARKARALAREMAQERAAAAKAASEPTG